MSEVLKYNIHNKHVAVLTLNRPKQRNAVNKVLAEAYKSAFQQTEDDPTVRVVLLNSSSEAMFCAGADLKEMSMAHQHGSDASPDFDINRWPRTKPWIAAVGGPAIAGGFEMVLGCDMVVATENASFAMMEVKLGMCAGAGALHRLTRFIPRNYAIELLLTGDFLDGKKAHQFGLVNHLVVPQELDKKALSIAEKIAANAPLAVKASLEVANLAYDLTEQELYKMSDERFRYLLETDDAKEGPRAFVEQRPPLWSGI